jgi:diguanylate cyclase (GGDEF)-like protein/PAS domain S-box-containing protein
VGTSLDEAVSRLLSTLVSRSPNARVAAISESGVATSVPPAVPVAGDRTLPSTFDAVIPSDHRIIIDLYGRARRSGMASGPVHLVNNPDRAVTAHLMDARTPYGVLLVVLMDGIDNGSASLGIDVKSHLPPRLARAHKDRSAVYTSVDAAFSEILGWSAEQMLGRRALEIIHPDDRDMAVDNWVEMLATPGLGRRVRLRHEHRDGRWVWLEITNLNRLDEVHEDVVADMVDISDEMAAHEALQAREELLNGLAQTVPLGLFHSDRDGVFLFANERLSDIVGADRIASIADLVDAIEPVDRPSVNEAVLSTLAGRGAADLELRIAGAGTGMRYAALRLRAPELGTPGFSGIIGCLEDVTDAVVMRRRLEIQASVDPLTACHNRSATITALEAMIKEIGRRDGGGLGIVYLDLDRFKPVNDAYGHGAGDQVLMVVAERLNRGVRAGDFVGRIGGDEFIVICPGVPSPDRALRIGETIRNRLCGAATVGAHEVRIAVSVGVAWTDDAGLDADVLLEAADAAMYTCKRDGLSEPVLAQPFDGLPVQSG